MQTGAGAKCVQDEGISRLQRHLCRLEPLLSDVSHYVTDLKRQLRCLHDAEAMCDREMVTIAARHTATFAVKLLRELMQ